MKGKKLASLLFACAIITSMAVPTFAQSPAEESELAPTIVEVAVDENEPAPCAYACPSCHTGSIVYGTRTGRTSTTGGTGHCRTCGLKGNEISRTVTKYERCNNSCGFSRDTETRVQYGLRCPSHGDKWN